MEFSTIWLINKLSISLHVAWFINFLLNIFGSFCRNVCWRLNLVLHVLLYLSLYTICLSVCTFVCLTKILSQFAKFLSRPNTLPRSKIHQNEIEKDSLRIYSSLVLCFFAFLGQKKVNQVFSFRAFSGFYCIQWFKSFSFYCRKNI